MRVICQVVNSAVLFESKSEISKIGRGLLVYAGFCENDNEQSILKIINKVCGLRVFSDSDGKLNLSLKDIGGTDVVCVQLYSVWRLLARLQTVIC